MIGGEDVDTLNMFIESLLRVGPFHSPKAQSPSSAHLCGSVQQPRILLSDASSPHKTNGFHHPSPKSPKSSNSPKCITQQPNVSPRAPDGSHKQKKKKRRHSEAETEPVTSSAPVTPPGPLETASERKRRKKKKKRKRESEDEEKIEEKESASPTPEEEWCQGGLWSLTCKSAAEPSKKKQQIAAESPELCEPAEEEQHRVRKKKKKKRQIVQDLQETSESSTRFAFNVIICFYGNQLFKLHIKYKNN